MTAIDTAHPPILRAEPCRTATDEQLARRAGAGDEQAFATLFARYQPRLETYCRSIVRHDEDARDAVQNTMTKALLALRREERELVVRPWLYRIAHNESITILRRRRPTTGLSELGEQATAVPRDMTGDLLVREEVRATLAGVRDLPLRLQRPLLLRELAGLNYEQVAQVTGTTSAAARRAVFEARALLTTDRAGREEACAVIRRSLEEGDGRRRRARFVRSHLSSCAACADWEREHRRPRRLALALLPADGAFGASLWSWLTGLLTGSGAGGGVLAMNTKAAASLSAIALGAAPVALVAEQAHRETAHHRAVATVAVHRAATTAAATPRAAAPASSTRPVTASTAATTTTAATGATRARPVVPAAAATTGRRSAASAHSSVTGTARHGTTTTGAGHHDQAAGGHQNAGGDAAHPSASATTSAATPTGGRTHDGGGSGTGGRWPAPGTAGTSGTTSAGTPDATPVSAPSPAFGGGSEPRADRTPYTSATFFRRPGGGTPTTTATATATAAPATPTASSTPTTATTTTDAG